MHIHSSLSVWFIFGCDCQVRAITMNSFKHSAFVLIKDRNIFVENQFTFQKLFASNLFYLDKSPKYNKITKISYLKIQAYIQNNVIYLWRPLHTKQNVLFWQHLTVRKTSSKTNFSIGTNVYKLTLVPYGKNR